MTNIQQRNPWTARRNKHFESCDQITCSHSNLPELPSLPGRKKRVTKLSALTRQSDAFSTASDCRNPSAPQTPFIPTTICTCTQFPETMNKSMAANDWEMELHHGFQSPFGKATPTYYMGLFAIINPSEEQTLSKKLISHLAHHAGNWLHSANYGPLGDKTLYSFYRNITRFCLISGRKKQLEFHNPEKYHSSPPGKLHPSIYGDISTLAAAPAFRQRVKWLALSPAAWVLFQYGRPVQLSCLWTKRHCWGMCFSLLTMVTESHSAVGKQYHWMCILDLCEFETVTSIGFTKDPISPHLQPLLFCISSSGCNHSG